MEHSWYSVDEVPVDLLVSVLIRDLAKHVDDDLSDLVTRVIVLLVAVVADSGSDATNDGTDMADGVVDDLGWMGNNVFGPLFNLVEVAGGLLTDINVLETMVDEIDDLLDAIDDLCRFQSFELVNNFFDHLLNLGGVIETVLNLVEFIAGNKTFDEAPGNFDFGICSFKGVSENR